MKDRRLGELALIDWMRKKCVCSTSVKQGIGDDTAVLPLDAANDLLFTTDMTVEGTHFQKQTPPALVGRKALARNLSDIAAMGGTPTCAVVSLGVPRDISTAYVKRIYEGMNRLAKEFGVSIVGGDTVKSAAVVINIALLGTVAKNKAVLRKGAKKGDQIFVTGALGGSLKSGRHLTFTPRVREAQSLVKDFYPTAMIDISDGLAGDLGHVLKESRLGAILDEAKIPLHCGADLKAGLYEGEDFELLFTLAPVNARKLLGSKKNNFYLIGEINGEKNKLFLRRESGKVALLQQKGFVHF